MAEAVNTELARWCPKCDRDTLPPIGQPDQDFERKCRTEGCDYAAMPFLVANGGPVQSLHGFFELSL